MARVRLLQLHQEQQQHGSVTEQSTTKIGGTSSSSATTTAVTNQWLDLVPSNPILPQIALPGGTPSSAVQMSSHHHHHHHNNNFQQHQDENGGSSSTESAHQARSGKPSKIPVVKSSYSVSKPPLSYREHHTHLHARDPYPSWNKCKSDQSLPRNCDPINNSYKNGGGNGSSIGSGKHRGPGTTTKQDSLQDSVKQHRARRDSVNSGSGGSTSLTRAKSQNHHHQRGVAVNSSTAAKDHNRAGGSVVTATAVVIASHHQQTATDDTNKVRPTKRFANILNSWIRKS